MNKNSYVIFQCIKCKGYLYSKTTAKTKKCMMCRKITNISDILGTPNSEIVDNLTGANNLVRKKNMETNDISNEFRSKGKFQTISLGSNKKPPSNNSEHQLEKNGIKLLIENWLSENEMTRDAPIPRYVLEMIISTHEKNDNIVQDLIKQFVKERFISIVE